MVECFLGGSSGIGLATAINLAKRGARIIIASRNEAKGQAAVKYISGKIFLVLFLGVSITWELAIVFVVRD